MSNGEIEKLIDSLAKDLTSDEPIIAILKRVNGKSLGLQNQVLNLLHKRLKFYGKIDLKRLLKTLENGSASAEPDVDDTKVYIKIAEKVLSEYNIITLELGNEERMMVFDSNSYTFKISKLKGRITSLIKLHNATHRYTYNEVIDYIKKNTLFDPKKLNYDPMIMNFSNGQYCFNKDGTGYFSPTDEDEKGAWHYFYEIPHDYEPIDEMGEKFRCPKFKNALRSWISAPFSKVRIRDIFEAIGLCMTMNMSFKAAFLNYGPPHSGKTQFFNVIVNLIGMENMAFTSLQRLGKNEFGAWGLEYKILNYCGDLPSKKVDDNGIFKDITGADFSVEAEGKGERKYNFIPVVHFWFNANKVPLFADWDDDATYERMIMFEFPNQFLEFANDTKKDFYKEIINNPKEMQGIVHEAIKGFKRLIKRGGFRRKLRENTKHLWNYNADVFYRFIYDFCKKSKRSKIQVDEFTDVFTEENPGYAKNTITKQLQRLGIKKKELRIKGTSKKSRYYVGVKWKPFVKDIIEALAFEEKQERSVDDLFTT